MSTKPLEPERLFRVCDPAGFTFQTTADLEPLVEILGQSRAVEALDFALAVERKGYNVFAFGPPGSGKHTLIRQHLETGAAERPVPADWCYVHNFETPHKPRALTLPSGRGQQLREDMRRLIDELRSAIPAAFEGEEYRARVQALDADLKEKQESALNELQERAQTKGIALIRSPQGLALAPMIQGKVVSPDVFQQWPEGQREQMQKDIVELEGELGETMQKIPRWSREHWESLRALNHEVTSFAIGHAMGELQSQYEGLDAVLVYLGAVQKDLIERSMEFLPQDTSTPEGMIAAAMQRPVAAPNFNRYRVNLLSGEHVREAAPVVYEDLPQFANLFGRIEHQAEFGALTTDFTLIKPGALHASNGGYLILDASRILTQPFVWETLKRALQSGELRLQNLPDSLGLPSTVTLDPEPIPLDVKVVLVGEPLLYYLLSAHDPDFPNLFKIAADFEPTVERDEATSELYARILGTLAAREQLKPLDPGGVARVIEHGSRLAGDREKMTLQMGRIEDLLVQADVWALRAGRDAITALDVQQAIDAQHGRSDRLQVQSLEAIRRGTIQIATEGAVVGQINALSVIQLGDYDFGRPTRITATVRLGRGQVMDIEREVELGGPLHSKGVMILAGYLGSRYAAEMPLALAATLVFEQSYGGVDGDSASSTELYAILSALAKVPIRQCLAVTGSVNQQGQVQAIGGVNEKIEGFFAVCEERGLSGEEGVLIPASNVAHLMLSKKVVDAVAAGQFVIYPIESIDEGIEILTGLPAGKEDADGGFPEGTLNHQVKARLESFAARAEAARSDRDDG